eukprot:scaffold77820_cov18-Prasinocladus_malaysianus.AAC.1
MPRSNWSRVMMTTDPAKRCLGVLNVRHSCEYAVVESQISSDGAMNARDDKVREMHSDLLA